MLLREIKHGVKMKRAEEKLERAGESLFRSWFSVEGKSKLLLCLRGRELRLNAKSLQRPWSGNRCFPNSQIEILQTHVAVGGS